MHEQLAERRVHPVAQQALDAGGIFALPFRFDRKRHLGRPAGHRAGRQQNGVPDRFVALAAPVEHPRQHRHIEVGVVVDADLPLAVVQAMQTAGILGNRSSP
ncbi:MAG: hypothetical protein AW07_01244 [Candidatus Accumulibacter sp. SK-11]|nr:MAG: hypothetical protein AW07_01244 [Candidatus Accumulibacter sp. SK-11]